MTCSRHCFHEEVCNKSDGSCSQCVDGYILPLCTDCADGRWALNCTQTCSKHCIPTEVCDKLNGTCTECDDGYKMPWCVNTMSPTNPGQGSNYALSTKALAGIVAGSCVAAVLIFCVIVAILIRIIRIRRKNKTEVLYVVQDDGGAINNDTTYMCGGAIVNGFVVSQEVPESAVTCKLTNVVKPPCLHTDGSETDGVCNGYYNMIPIKTETRYSVPDFITFTLNKLGKTQAFSSEFKDIPESSEKETAYSSNETLKPKNRYKNILPYDETRVKLTEVPGVEFSDYINASFIPNYNKNEKAFIASHGPTAETVYDFWRMILGYKVTTIVMLTNTQEHGKLKCVQYWPIDGEVHYRDITITKISSKNDIDFTVVTLEIQKGDDCRTVEHYCCKTWPDHDLPDTTALIKLIRCVHRVRDQAPVLVHCSAGVGRTGTFIAIDYLLDEAKATGFVDVKAAVKHLRSYRMKMVQTLSQYLFIYEIVAEILAVGNTVISIQSITETFNECKENWNKLLTLQFKYLLMFSQPHTNLAVTIQNDENKAHLNVELNQNMTITKNNMDIATVFLPGYRSNREFCCTTIPVPNKVVDFWRLVLEYKCKTVVCLEIIQEQPEWYPTSEGLKLDDKELYKVSETWPTYGRLVKVHHGRCSEDTVYENTPENVSISIYIVNEATSSSRTRALIDVYRNIADTRRDEDSPTFVVCRDGVTESGLFVACCATLNMAGCEQEVDIYGIVRKIRKIRPEYISTEDQFEILHKALEIFVTEKDTEYANT